MWIIRDLNLNWSHFYTDEATNRELIGEVKNMKMNEGMTQVIEKITRRRIVDDRVKESVLDHIYTSAQDRLGQVGVRDVTSSDHSIITFTRK